MMAQSRYVVECEDSLDNACANEAARNGYSYVQAQNCSCDEGYLECKNCPFIMPPSMFKSSDVARETV